MKGLTLLLVGGMVMLTASCRVNPPLDPHSMKPSCKCMPGKFRQGYPSTCTDCDGRVIVDGK